MGINIVYGGRLLDVARGAELVSAVRSLCGQMKWGLRTIEQLREEGHVQCTGLSGLSVQTHPDAEWLNLHWDAQGQLVNHFYYALVNDRERCAAFTQLMRDNARQVQELLGDLDAQGSALSAEQHAEQNIRRGAQDAHDVDAVDVEADTDLDAVAVGPSDGAALRAAPFGLWIPGARDLQADLQRGVTYNWVKTQRGGAAGHIGVCQVLDLVRAAAPELSVQDESGYFEHRDIRVLEGKLAEVERMLAVFRRAVDQLNTSPEAQRPKTFTEFMVRLNEALGQTEPSSNLN